MNQQYAGFWIRLIAFSIDNLILHLVSLLVLVAIALLSLIAGFDLFPDDSEGDLLPAGGSMFLACILMMTSMQIFYYVYFHGTTGQTPGKKLLGIQVVQVSGRPMTPGIAFLRWVGYIVSAMFLYLGFLWIIFDGKKQGWHDKIAKTAVVKARKSGARQSEFDFITPRFPTRGGSP